MAVAWVRERAARSAATLVPIIGPRDLSQLDSYLAALDVQLTNEQYARLDKVGAMPLGVPHEGVAGSPGHLQGGDASSVIVPVVPVARARKHGRRRALRAGTGRCRADAERADQKTPQTVS
ncbi:hypothetical protein [Streptomyces sp. rh34]|uniref:hypothetical protein n=1 Tax=Streptomyces sp. rh34 TaxID=2034272 RepID=UPI00211DA376|nr:hypothetical protein [Streptomyces sp. rh34]